jgi:repressor LexA
MAYPKDFSDIGTFRSDEPLHSIGIEDRDAFAARISGDSMAPEYRQGDLVIFSPMAAPRNGDDCFVRLDDGQTTFKRVYFEADGKGRATLRLQPRNRKYRAKIVVAEKITGVWKAVCRYTRVNAADETALAAR